MNEKIFSHFIAEKNLNIFRIIILCNKYNIFDTKILSRGYSTKFQGMGAYMTSNPHSVKWKFQGSGGGGGGEGGGSITRMLCLQNFKTLFSLYGLPLVSVMCRENIHNPSRRGTEIPEGLGGCQNEAISEGVGGLLTEVFFQGVWVRLVS